jgi:thiol-disulfide isomerase/thioredoxin
MKKNYLRFIAALLSCSVGVAGGQGVLSYEPLHPQTGDTIRISYLLPENYLTVPQGHVVSYRGTRESISEINLDKKESTFRSYIATDSSMTLLALSFKNGEVHDNNSNHGFFIPLYDGNKVKKNAYYNQARFVDFFGVFKFQLKPDNRLILKLLEAEGAVYPENKRLTTSLYLSTLYRINQSEARTEAERHAAEILVNPSLTKKDYENLEDIYAAVALPEKSAAYKKLRAEKIPYNKYDPGDLREMLRLGKSITLKEEWLKEVENQSQYPNNAVPYGKLIIMLKENIALNYIDAKNWPGFESIMKTLPIQTQFRIYYGRAARKAIEDSVTWDLAAAFAKQSVDFSREEWLNPQGEVPNFMTRNEMIQSSKDNYGFAAKSYVEILIKLNRYPEALPYAKEAAYTVKEGREVEYNSLYASIAEKTLPPKKYIPQLEQFVTDGREDSSIVMILKKAYILQGHTTAKSLSFIENLRRSAHDDLAGNIKDQMLNKESFPFELKDLAGNSVQLADYKGKVVVLDFWATWCAPCIASFPVMNEVAESYKADPSVVFLFVNSLQTGDDRIKPVRDFMKSTQYGFRVLLDTADKVADLYNVKSLPTKIIIGKDGKIKFDSKGFYGTEILKKELPVMIEQAK